jgi:rod shape determining protein RodA
MGVAGCKKHAIWDSFLCHGVWLSSQKGSVLANFSPTIDITATNGLTYDLVALRKIRDILLLNYQKSRRFVKSDVWVRRLPWSIVFAALLLIGLGWLGIARVEELTEGSGRLLRQQIAHSVIAVVLMLLMTSFNYRILSRFSYLLFLLSIILLLVVFRCPVVNNVHRWIRVGTVGGFQPSDLAKAAYILAMARYLMYRDNYRRLRGLAAPLALTLAPVLLILKEPDLGTALVFFPVFFAMLFAAGAKRGDLACVALTGILVLPLLWMQMNTDQKSRVVAVFDQPSFDRQPNDQTRQLFQAKQVRALGGVWGSLFTGEPTDDAAAYSLPEAESDFIFSILGERLGLPGMALVLGLFGVLVGQGVAIAAETREPFGRLLVTGITALVAVEVLINTGMTVGLFPVKGFSLPLVSHGGSGLVAHAMMLGLLLNVGLRPGYEMTNEPFRWSGEQ